jgi:topoisomerase-4 subunit A
VTDIAPTPEIRDTGLAEALGERYLSYAISTIMSRSLPDVRDGLKPVQRRLLYAMRELRLNPSSGFKKCARVVGDVIGKYHPHGDAAVYDTLVRLAQEFAQRYPLVEGQGNFGSIDGDNAAAMRYTEARLTEVAEALLEGIDEDAVDFRDTYDAEGQEPVVLPAAFPNLLANGAAGIAVGMATSVPPHNAGEVCAALLQLIKYPKATIAKLVELVPGPDLPTGGELVEPADGVVEAYAKGRGSFRLRARWTVEKVGRGQYQIVVTEIPYQVQKSRLIERIAELMEQKKLAMLADVRDESAADLRLVLEPRARTIDPHVLMEALFRHTELEVRLGLNLNVLDGDGAPRVMNLREVLQAFLDHRHEVLRRRSAHRLSRIERRLAVLGGYLTVYGNLDEVIRTIRTEDEPKRVLMRRWKLTEVQADAVLEMRLRALRKLEEAAIREEFAALQAEGEDLAGLLKDEKRRWKLIAQEIAGVRKRFGPDTKLGARRTKIGEPPAEVVVPREAMITREPVTVVCSAKGWIRAVKGRLGDDAELRYKEGDRARFVLRAQSTDKLVVFATNGRFYTLEAERLLGARGHGEPLRLMIDLGNDQDVVSLFVHQPDRKLLVAAGDGRGFLVSEKDVSAHTRAGKQVLNVSGDVEARACAPAEGDHVAVLGENRKLLVFPLEELPTMGRGRGVLLQRYRRGGLADVKVFDLADGLSWTAGSRTRTHHELGPWLGQRAAAGRLPPAGFSRANRFA